MNATIFAALAKPNRLRILELLRHGPHSVGEIAEQLGLRQPQASKHLRVLSNAGLVVVNPSANRRIYALRVEPLHDLENWLETFRKTWEARFDRLDEWLRVADSENREPRSQTNVDKEDPDE